MAVATLASEMLPLLALIFSTENSLMAVSRNSFPVSFTYDGAAGTLTLDGRLDVPKQSSQRAFDGPRALPEPRHEGELCGRRGARDGPRLVHTTASARSQCRGKAKCSQFCTRGTDSSINICDVMSLESVLKDLKIK